MRFKAQIRVIEFGNENRFKLPINREWNAEVDHKFELTGITLGICSKDKDNADEWVQKRCKRHKRHLKYEIWWLPSVLSQE
jgi:hypothetical protein